MPKKRRQKKECLVLAEMLERLAPLVGARVVLEPEWRIAGQIIFADGRKRYFRYNTLDLNPVGASDIAKDKDYATFFMREMGYSTIPGKTFFSDHWCEAIDSKRNISSALRWAAREGFPLIAKPNSGTHGSNVFLTQTPRELERALKRIFKHDKIALVQHLVTGRDYRVVVLDDRVISAYERVPLNVTGDGRATIEQLLAKKQRGFTIGSRDTRIRLDDPRIANKLKHLRLSLESVLPKGERVFLLDNANLSSGGDAIDVTEKIHPGFKDLAVRLTRDMGLRLCGVDIMTEGDIREAPTTYHILEINAAPGLDHYVKTGDTQKKIVEELYVEVLRSLAK